MAISHEISSEIAAALIALRNKGDKSPHELQELKEMLLQIHSTLEDLQQQAREHTANEQMKVPPLTKAVGQQT